VCAGFISKVSNIGLEVIKVIINHPINLDQGLVRRIFSETLCNLPMERNIKGSLR